MSTIWSEDIARPTCTPTSTTPGCERSSWLSRPAIRSISAKEVPGAVSTWSSRLRSARAGSRLPAPSWGTAAAAASTSTPTPAQATTGRTSQRRTEPSKLRRTQRASGREVSGWPLPRISTANGGVSIRATNIEAASANA